MRQYFKRYAPQRLSSRATHPDATRPERLETHDKRSDDRHNTQPEPDAARSWPRS